MSTDLYIPQYQKKDETWEDFKVKTVENAITLKNYANHWQI
jgi:hypothetical protein